MNYTQLIEYCQNESEKVGILAISYNSLIIILVILAYLIQGIKVIRSGDSKGVSFQYLFCISLFWWLSTLLSIIDDLPKFECCKLMDYTQANMIINRHNIDIGVNQTIPDLQINCKGLFISSYAYATGWTIGLPLYIICLILQPSLSLYKRKGVIRFMRWGLFFIYLSTIALSLIALALILIYDGFNGEMIHYYFIVCGSLSALFMSIAYLFQFIITYQLGELANLSMVSIILQMIFNLLLIIFEAAIWKSSPLIWASSCVAFVEQIGLISLRIYQRRKADWLKNKERIAINDGSRIIDYESSFLYYSQTEEEENYPVIY